MRCLILCISILATITSSAQTYLQHLKRNAPAYSSIFLAGAANGLQDAVSHEDLYNQTTLPKWSPGKYWGPKTLTWPNKWKPGQIGKERFPLSSTAFVGFTDAWHGAQTLSNTAWQVGALTYKQPPKFWHKVLDLILFKALYGLGWHTMDTILRKRP